MTKEESRKLDQITDTLAAHGKNIERIITSLTGDELKQYPGLIAEQKRDNEFREVIKEQLNTILQQQQVQLSINSEVKERLDSMEQFMTVIRAFSKLKKSTIYFIVAIMAGLGYLLLKFQSIGKWVWQAWQNVS